MRLFFVLTYLLMNVIGVSKPIKEHCKSLTVNDDGNNNPSFLHQYYTQQSFIGEHECTLSISRKHISKQWNNISNSNQHKIYRHVEEILLKLLSITNGQELLVHSSKHTLERFSHTKEYYKALSNNMKIISKINSIDINDV